VITVEVEAGAANPGGGLVPQVVEAQVAEARLPYRVNPAETVSRQSRVASLLGDRPALACAPRTPEIARLSATWHGRASLRGQALDAAESVVLNLGEGAAQPPRSGAKRRHYVIALGSADEVGAALDAARAQGLSPAGELDAARARVARCAALVGGLVRSATARRR
jgi:four helix bundle protein